MRYNLLRSFNSGGTKHFDIFSKISARLLVYSMFAEFDTGIASYMIMSALLINLLI